MGGRAQKPFLPESMEAGMERMELGRALANIFWFVPVLIVLAVIYFYIVGWVENQKDRKKVSHETML